MVYPAKQDWWVACLVVPASVVLVGVGAVTAYQATAQGMPLAPRLILVAATVETAGIGGLLLWMFCATSYEIRELDLISRLGPFYWRVPLNAIEEVVSTNGFRLIVGLGLSWSMDMVHVKYRKPNSKTAFPVSISPRNKTEFLQELATAAPDVKMTGGGGDHGERQALCPPSEPPG